MALCLVGAAECAVNYRAVETRRCSRPRFQAWQESDAKPTTWGDCKTYCCRCCHAGKRGLLLKLLPRWEAWPTTALLPRWEAWPNTLSQLGDFMDNAMSEMGVSPGVSGS